MPVIGACIASFAGIVSVIWKDMDGCGGDLYVAGSWRGRLEL
jgi:hypothetical protein